MSNPEAARRPGRRQRPRGLALIDMLVGLALGAMVIVAALGALSMARQSSGSVGDLHQLHTQGAFALRVIGRHVRQAGALEPTQDPASGLHVFDDRLIGFAGGSSLVAGSDGADAEPDTLSVSHQPAAASDAHRLDCLSEVVRTGERIDSTFFLRRGELRCRTTSKNQALIGQVADFQVMYRVRNALQETRRLNASQLTAQSLWRDVRAVEVCIDLKGDLPAAAAGNDSYRDCRGADVTRGGRQRLVLRQVFALRTSTAP